jgi:NitT/TauT family transport system substrate-binding protein
MLRRLAGFTLVAVAVTIAPPPVAAPGAGAQPKPKVTATLRLDWVPGSHHIGPLLAVERGYYAQEGIDLTVRPGKGSGATVQLVAADRDLFGFADAGVMAIAVSKGAPLVMIANTTPRGPIGAITLGPTPTSPKDIEGKTVGLVPGEASQAALLALMSKAHIPPSAYRVVAVEAASKVPALLTGKVDVIPGFRFGDFLRAWAQNRDTKIALFSDWGLNIMGNGYLVSTTTLAQKPDVVRGFLRATRRGWKDAIADPKAGVAALMKAYPETNREFAELGLPMVIEHMHSEATRGKPLGWMAEEDWRATLEVMKGAGLEGDAPPSTYYRNLVEP